MKYAIISTISTENVQWKNRGQRCFQSRDLERTLKGGGDLSWFVAQLIKNLPSVQETWVRSLGWEDSLEKEKATHSSILAWRVPWAL